MSTEQHPAAVAGDGRDPRDVTRPEGPAPHGAWEPAGDDVAGAWSDDEGAGSAWAPPAEDPAWDQAAPLAAAWDEAVLVATGWDGAEPAATERDGAEPAAAAWDEADPVATARDEPDVLTTGRAEGGPDERHGERGAAPDDVPAGVPGDVAEPVRALREALAARGLDAGASAEVPPRPGPGPAARPARGARRGTGRGRRAPATEPPGDGPAAVDAEPDHESVARAIVLRQLTAAPRSRQQLAEALARREVPEDVADRVLDRFTEVGLVDDAAYAEVLVRSRHAERGLSRRALALELRRRGVDDGIAQDALAQVDDDDEEHAARALARKKLASTRGMDRETRLRRAYGALGRRGYGGSLVARVVREELEAEGAPDDEDGGGRFG